jgi:ABC-type Na+ efflux pump permease subunit
MKWFIFAIIAAAILVIFGAVYGISYLVNKRKQPKYKTTAPDDDPQFLRDLAKRLKEEDKKDDTDTGAEGESNTKGDDEPK